jgi:hypothetical protein
MFNASIDNETNSRDYCSRIQLSILPFPNTSAPITFRRAQRKCIYHNFSSYHNKSYVYLMLRSQSSKRSSTRSRQEGMASIPLLRNTDVCSPPFDVYRTTFSRPYLLAACQLVKCTGNPRVWEVRPQPLPAQPATRAFGYGFWRVWVAGLVGFGGPKTRAGQRQG